MVKAGGAVPAVADTFADAKALLRRDGAVRMAVNDTSEKGARGVLRALFGEQLRALPPAAWVSDGGGEDRRLEGADHHDPLPVHTDGFAYGDLYPDYLMLSCIRSSASGGDSFLVDGYAVLEEIGADPARAWVQKALEQVAVDQTDEGMQVAHSPIVQRTGQGRLMVRRVIDEAGWGPKPLSTSSTPERDRQMIEAWIDAIEQAQASAPRFVLAEGEAVIIDNYRMFHGREGYCDPSRALWRVWAWTDMALGVPDLPLHSDSRFAGDQAGQQT